MIRALALAALLVAGAAGDAHAQLFLGSRPDPQLSVGPLFVTATATPTLDVTVDILWSLTVPPTRSAADLEQTIVLLWPGEIVPDPQVGKADPAVNKYVETRGFTVVEDGRVELFARSAYQLESDAPPERVEGGAPFVTFVRQGGALGLTPAASLVQMTWHPKMANRAWLMNLRFRTRGLVKAKPATWLESTFWGDRHRLELAFNDVRSRALFPLYFEHRDRVLQLANDPSQLVILFPEADRLKIDEMTPASATRRRHESLERTEVVSRFLDTTEGIVPQMLTVQFGYFSGLQWWAPILIPALFFVLGNALRPAIAVVAAKLGRIFASRFHVGAVERQTGTVLSREQLARIVPGETTRTQVLEIAGGAPEGRTVAPEEIEQLDAPDRRALIYRGRRVIPHRRRRFMFISTVESWEIEDHEVEITLERDVVQNVQARVRHSRRRDPSD